MSQTRWFSGWRYQALLISIALSALGYLLFSLWGGWDDVVQAVARVGLFGVLLALLMSLVNYGLRFLRWQLYLSLLSHRVPWLVSLRIYLAGFALTTTPGKAGEAMRGVLLRPWSVDYTHSFALFFSERLSDLLAIVLLTLFGLLLYPDATWLILLGLALVGFCFVILSQRRLLRWSTARIAERKGPWWQALLHVLQMLASAQRCHRPLPLLLATLLSLIAWSAEALAFYWILGWMGFPVTLPFACFVYALAMLAGALSFMPGGLGGAEAVMAGLLIWKGMAPADAVAATVLIRLATLWFAVAIGVVCLQLESRAGVRKHQPVTRL
ncbi:lysylphosphatidylglycerol synthase transmembrane domain-containing protein [Halopseudomonas salegens]|uniref:Lysylphosphatidylglycerol synthase-like protein n=1 Tax=Halopseudomonas salegens TaxID=1434072 RepID=A0A1H2EGN7_9GAMM|nr:lysylphosphatidylglycerol synthase transmembrane domain-containing protein [Halopseudomonas salegens]SDT94153.1 conserved hypothetical protein [Halopseudomonas salegens]